MLDPRNAVTLPIHAIRDDYSNARQFTQTFDDADFKRAVPAEPFPSRRARGGVRLCGWTKAGAQKCPEAVRPLTHAVARALRGGPGRPPFLMDDLLASAKPWSGPFLRIPKSAG